MLHQPRLAVQQPTRTPAGSSCTELRHLGLDLGEGSKLAGWHVQLGTLTNGNVAKLQPRAHAEAQALLEQEAAKSQAFLKSIKQATTCPHDHLGPCPRCLSTKTWPHVRQPLRHDP